MKKMISHFHISFKYVEDKAIELECQLPADTKIVSAKLSIPSQLFVPGTVMDNVLQLTLAAEHSISNDATNLNMETAKFLLVPEHIPFDTKPAFHQWVNERIERIPLEERESYVFPKSRDEYVFVTIVAETLYLYQQVYEFSAFDLQ